MSDTQRLDWLERNPWGLLCKRGDDGSIKFQVLLTARPEKPASLDYSGEYDALRDALDEGMKQKL